MINETKPFYILLGAQRRVGKDTFAKMLEKELSLHVPTKIVSFAGALKSEVQEALEHLDFPCTNAWTEDPGIKEKVMRPLLIAWGNGRRYFDENYWVDQVIRVGNSFQSHRDINDSPYRFIIVPDWRFPNERLRIRETLPEGGKVIAGLIWRDGVTPTPDEEKNVPLCAGMSDFKIENRGSLEDLQKIASGFINDYLLSPLC